MTVTSGRKCIELSKLSILDGCLARMSAVLFQWKWASTECFLTWKPAATPSGRLLFRLRPSMPRIEESESGLWPTMTADDAKHPGRVKIKPHQQTCLSAEAAKEMTMWPTPTEGDSRTSGSRNTPGSKAHPGISLTDAARGDGGTGRMWSTPRSSDGEKGGPNQSFGAGGQPLASQAAHQMWATPEQRDYKSGSMTEEGHAHRSTHPRGKSLSEQGGGALNPSFVEFLMGFPPYWTEV